MQTVEVREVILDATDDFLARHGYKKMTIDDLAQAVGIGEGSIYLHFSSKEEIALSHIDRVIERLKAELKIIAAEKVSFEERIRRMLLKRVLHRFDSVQHYTQSLNDILSAIRPKFLARRKTYFEEEAEIFAVVIREGQKAEIFGGEYPLEAATMLLLATNSLLPFSLTTRELGERDEVEEKTGGWLIYF
ncbi:MAG: TetR/AcrR family transcriptional regulator [Acidobacteriota bacterium]|nr:TetR/AcrR family transcriptional regulator [Acidobacteriota bacterium]